jgi:hypothetical protein
LFVRFWFRRESKKKFYSSSLETNKQQQHFPLKLPFERRKGCPIVLPLKKKRFAEKENVAKKQKK